MRKIPHKVISSKPGQPGEPILPLLKGHVFHVTTEEGYQGIMKDGMVKNNRNCEFPYSYGQSKNSYGRKRGYVCLFDLRDASDEIIKESLRKFSFLNPEKALDNPFFLILSEEAYPHLILEDQARRDNPYQMRVPYIECWYPGHIPIDKIERVIERRITIGEISHRYKHAKTIVDFAFLRWLEKREELKKIKAAKRNALKQDRT